MKYSQATPETLYQALGAAQCKCQAKNPLSIRKQKSPKQKTEKSKGLLKTMQNSRPPLLEAGGIFN